MVEWRFAGPNWLRSLELQYLGKAINDCFALLSRLYSIYIFDLHQLNKLEMLLAIRKIVFWLLKLCKQ